MNRAGQGSGIRGRVSYSYVRARGALLSVFCTCSPDCCDRLGWPTERMDAVGGVIVDELETDKV